MDGKQKQTDDQSRKSGDSPPTSKDTKHHRRGPRKINPTTSKVPSELSISSIVEVKNATHKKNNKEQKANTVSKNQPEDKDAESARFNPRAFGAIPPSQSGSTEDIGLPFILLDKSMINLLEDNADDRHIADELSDVMAHYKGEYQEDERENDAEFRKYPEFNYTEMTNFLKQQGIPIPMDDDMARLESDHSSRWDPDGTVVEYYSPVLRSFIPVNMRGRYRGCWAEDHCIQGLDISKVKPKPDALEGFVDQGRQVNIAAKYQEMFDVAEDGAHLDYLIEMQKRQAETLPIPIMYDVVNFGVEVLKKNLEYFVHDAALPPTSRIYETTESHLLNMRQKVQIYASLGLEPINSESEVIGNVSTTWRMTRDELISIVLEKRHKPDDFEQLVETVASLYQELDKTGDGKKGDVEKDGENEDNTRGDTKDQEMKSVDNKKKESDKLGKDNKPELTKDGVVQSEVVKKKQ